MRPRARTASVWTCTGETLPLTAVRTLLLLRAVGRVNMVGADHVGVLVFNMFNVSIGRDNIRKDLRFVDTVRPGTGGAQAGSP